MKNNFEIIDNNGVIHSGHEFEMKKAFDFMAKSESFLMDNYGMNKKGVKQLIEKWKIDWDGDLKLIEVHNVTR